jgi:nicotinamide/nicotinate riboside kinase
MLVGIGGCSCSGKTTLAEALVWHYRTQNKTAIALHQDDFVRKTSDIPLINDRTDWEVPASMDFEKMEAVVGFFQQHFEVVIVEGLFAFAFEPLCQLYDHCFFVEISEEVFKQRRKAAQRWGAEPDWFVQYVWDSFLKHGQPPTTAKCVSGEMPFEIDKIAPVLSGF